MSEIPNNNSINETLKIIKKALQEDDVKNSEEYLNIYDIGKNFYCKALLHIDKVWYFKGRYSCKLKVKELILE